MAKVFNGNMWSGIGGSINAQRAYRDQERKDGLDALANSAMAVEKMNANSRLRDAILDYYKGRQDAAAEAEDAEAVAAGEMIDESLSREKALADLAWLEANDDEFDDTVFADDGRTIKIGPMFEKFSKKKIPFINQREFV
ncbi:MAG: hypothetical protein MJY87_02395 [Fibrobacter sp.]|nr:hypothetical protein [Fibrobacter sp.]